ncbi:MAG: hypothetical protein WBE74_22295 [Terracidiphilus sp.]
MKSPTVIALLIVCSTGLHAQGLVAQATSVLPMQADSSADDGQFAPWRTLFNSGKVTLGQVRLTFLYQDVIVNGTLENLGRSSQLLEWRIASKTPESIQADTADAQKFPRQARYFVPHAMDGLPQHYSGRRANVIAVQLHNPQATGATSNAMGEAFSDDSAINPCFDLVVHFDDGTTAMTTQYPATLANASLAEPVSVINAAAERMQRELPDLIGIDVYAAGFTQLYKPDSTINEILNQVDSKKIPPADIPLLEPLTIVAAKYVDSAGVLIEVQFPDGDKALALTSMPQLFLPPLDGRQQTFLERVIGLFLEEIPGKLTKRELAAIRSGSIYRGMRENALEYVMGFPDKESDSGDGGKQLTFRKSLLVHVGYSGTVEDWKFLDEK